MFNKRSQFTLIELIVVIAVLGILAAIVIPNISNFQQKAKEVQLTADVRNLQTAVDMYRIDSLDGVSEPVGEFKALATHEVLEDGTIKALEGSAKVQVQILDMDGLYPDYLRDIPDASSNETVTADLTTDVTTVDFEKGQVVFGTMADVTAEAGDDGILGTADDANVVYGKSTAIVKAVSIVDNAGTDVIAIVR